MTSLGILDLGYGNVFSIQCAFNRLDCKTTLVNTPEGIQSVDRLVVPGVGAAKTALNEIARLELTDVIKTYSKPLLGICLGMQVLAEELTEGADSYQPILGLGLIEGKVEKMSTPSGVLPHMGWNRIQNLQTVENNEQSYFYFAHSYALTSSRDAVGVTEYDETQFVSLVQRENIVGIQCHPERSGQVGESFLKRFLSM